MESEDSLTHSQAPATFPCTEPNQSIPRYPTSWRSILALSSHLRLRLTSCVFPSGLPPKPHTHPSCHPYVPYALLRNIYHIKNCTFREKKTKFVMKYDLKRTRNLERPCARLCGWTQVILLRTANGHLVTGSVDKMARMGLSLISRHLI